MPHPTGNSSTRPSSRAQQLAAADELLIDAYLQYTEHDDPAYGRQLVQQAFNYGADWRLVAALNVAVAIGTASKGGPEAARTVLLTRAPSTARIYAQLLSRYRRSIGFPDGTLPSSNTREYWQRIGSVTRVQQFGTTDPAALLKFVVSLLAPAPTQRAVLLQAEHELEQELVPM